MFSFPISRLCPLFGGNARFVQEDVVLSGYQVPAGIRAFDTTVIVVIVCAIAVLSTYRSMRLFYSVHAVTGSFSSSCNW